MKSGRCGKDTNTNMGPLTDIKIEFLKKLIKVVAPKSILDVGYGVYVYQGDI